jgi:7-cyano-7-deazaguanine reductase
MALDTNNSDLPLGKQIAAVNEYSPSLLFPIRRAEARASLNLPKALPFVGEDLWTGYELAWLDGSGKPVVGIVEIRIPCDSECIVESKSLKLYLNSLYRKAFTDQRAIEACIQGDLENVTHSSVVVLVRGLDEASTPATLPGTCLDSLDVTKWSSEPDSAFLTLSEGESAEPVYLQLYSHLLRSLCPVTSQPDWGSLYIEYNGRPIDQAGLLAYILGFREHQDFHEHCVERIYCDLEQAFQPEQLSVYARYTRRGGLDINPWRSNTTSEAPDWRTSRQ